MIEFLADDYDIWGGYTIHQDWVYKKLQYIQAYCNGIKPVAYCSEAMGKLIFDMKYGDEQRNWRGFTIRMDKRLPFLYVIIYCKRKSWRTKNLVVWDEVIQFGDCSDREKDVVSRILLRNLKEGVNL